MSDVKAVHFLARWLTQEACEAVEHEIDAAVSKHGEQAEHPDFLWALIMGEEAGEVQQAVLQALARGKKSGDIDQHTYEEVVQTAAVCLHWLVLMDRRRASVSTPTPANDRAVKADGNPSAHAYNCAAVAVGDPCDCGAELTSLTPTPAGPAPTPPVVEYRDHGGPCPDGAFRARPEEYTNARTGKREIDISRGFCTICGKDRPAPSTAPRSKCDTCPDNGPACPHLACTPASPSEAQVEEMARWLYEVEGGQECRGIATTWDKLRTFSDSGEHIYHEFKHLARAVIAKYGGIPGGAGKGGRR